MRTLDANGMRHATDRRGCGAWQHTYEFEGRGYMTLKSPNGTANARTMVMQIVTP